MTITEFDRLATAAERFNKICDEKGIPCRAAAQKIWLDFGAKWSDYSICIRDLTKPANDICSSVQVDFRDREDAMAGNIDVAVERMLKYGIVTRKM